MTLLLPRNILGFEISSDSRVFLTVLSFHVLAALGSVVTGIIAMLSPKRSGRHPRFGTIYYWCLTVVFMSATVLAAMRWSDDAYLFSLGAASFSGRNRRTCRPTRTMARVGTNSYLEDGIVLHHNAHRISHGQWQKLAGLEGPSERGLYWLIPSAVGVPLIVRAVSPIS